MAHTPTLQPLASRPGSRQQCPVRMISILLCKSSGEPLRLLFLDREGHISAGPHYLPREQALILAANQQRIWGSAAQVQVL
jgi:hypothetical protein